MLIVAPFRPLWWVERRLLRLLICAALAAAFWAGQQAAAQPESSQFAINAALTARSMSQSVLAVDGAAGATKLPSALSALLVTPYLAAPMREKLPSGPDQHRVPPRR